MEKSKHEALTRSVLRLSMAVCAPLAIFFGARATVQAEVPNPPVGGKKLSAAEMKANFDYLKPEIFFGTPLVGQAKIDGAAGNWAQVPEITLVITPKFDGKFKIHGNFAVHCTNPKSYEIPIKLGVSWSSGVISGDLKLNAISTAGPAIGGTAVASNFTMQPAVIAPLKAGQTYVFNLRSVATDCQNAYITGNSDSASDALLIAERIAELRASVCLDRCAYRVSSRPTLPLRARATWTWYSRQRGRSALLAAQPS